VLQVLSRDEIQAMGDIASTGCDRLIVRTLADAGVPVGEGD